MRHYYFPVHVVALVSLWLEFKNSVKVEIGVLYWQPFMNIHQFCCTGSPHFAFKTIYEQPFFYFFSTVEATTCQVYICNHS